ncbi:uncharacterized protein PAC_04325 [Phialocephala subalpina]|uniref:Uncharacterized protein n=1 Tax=Phialocephala subalpina TaxID=576137 RepID=A0A1L7WNV4_9HELO|nr:uncharacterized protein PAC_04325 [Phialocephala subalpina]
MATGNMEYGIENIGVGMEALGVLNEHWIAQPLQIGAADDTSTYAISKEDPSRSTRTPSPLPPSTVSKTPTFSEVQAFRDSLNEIWNFKARRWINVNNSEGKSELRSLYIQYAKKLFKVTYFKTHRCSQQDIETHLKKAQVLAVFTQEEWDKQLATIEKHLHGRILTAELVDGLMKTY